MRFFAVTLILAYGGLALFGLGMMPHGEHGVCPFNALSGDCAIVGSLGSALNHLEAFAWALLALPTFLIFAAGLIVHRAVSGVPPSLLSYEPVRAENIFVPRRRTFQRWLSLVSSYS